jgi:hypothetical protein
LPESYADSNSDLYADAYCDGDGDSYGYIYAYSHGNSYLYTYSDRDGDVYPDANSDSDCNCNANGYSDGYCHSHTAPNHIDCSGPPNKRATSSGSILERRDFESGRCVPQRCIDRYYRERRFRHR